jgi:hypothetical protein
MMPRAGWAVHALHLGLLRAASLLAPARLRAEWWREWRAELWHVRRERAPSGALSWPVLCEVTGFCLGAFRDAFCLRSHAERREEQTASRFGSPVQCLACLALALAASFTAALLLPGVRLQREETRVPLNSGLILIRDPGAGAAISTEQFRRWKASPQRFVDGLAFYRLTREGVSIAGGEASGWQVAHAGEDLFPMMGLPIRFAAMASGRDMSAPALILSCREFELGFGGNPQIIGSALRVGATMARIAGVAPCGDFGLPGKADAWLLGPDAFAGSSAMGYVVAHLSALGQWQMTTSRIAIVSEYDGTEDGLYGDAIDGHAASGWEIYLFAAFLAFLALPAVTSVSMAESSFSSHRATWQARVSRSGFLAAKIALLLPGVYFISLDLAYANAAAESAWPQYIQLVSSFCLCLFGMRWILLDQRRRCPVCLRRVTHPARVGDASRTFLAWNGTEMICTAGHTLLHVPGLPTSWFGAPRWLYLDNSWEFLFARSSQG